MGSMKSRIDCFRNNSGIAFQWVATGAFLTLLMQKLCGITDIGWLWVFMPLVIYGVLLFVVGILVLTMIAIHWRHRPDNDDK